MSQSNVWLIPFRKQAERFMPIYHVPEIFY